MNKTGLNMGSVRRQNRTLILSQIYSAGPMSRKDLANTTGLTAASVTQIVSRLISEGLLVESKTSDEPSRAAGRRKIPIDIKADAEYVLAVNIEPDVTNIALCDLKARAVTDKDGTMLIKTMDTDSSILPEAFLGKVSEECSTLLSNAPSGCKDRLHAVSVGINGIVDIPEGRSVHAYGIWKEPVDIGKILGSKLGLPVIIENNVDAVATAALLFGTGRTDDNLFIVKWGPGVGSAIILNGNLYKAPNGRPADFGHMAIDNNDKLCECGRRGCLETMVSYNALNELMPFDLNDFEERYAQAPADVKKQIDRALYAFARCIINTSTILAPRRVVLFGKMLRNEALWEKLISACKYYDPAYDEKLIIRTVLADREDYIGPAAVYVQNRLNAL